ncbi:hypothetical protein N7510_008633 [Penicillium lagena]|uniref:uncharacterized protein n=1 Tax=Penicillium lagena TaxID=94218 RepID=UPI002540F978|nr:uncharacterized protein N7510_008633 [Penicillium lagena]KAJ5605852.1 hypothetical protein N7510_008633 [Penicillium lagena]
MPEQSPDESPASNGASDSPSPNPDTLCRDEPSEKQTITSSNSRFVPERWRTASQRIRHRTAALAEKLGRPHEGGEDGLDGGISPEYYGATDDMRGFEARQAQDEESRLLDMDHDSQARRIVQQLGLHPHKGRARRKAQEPRSGTVTPDSGTSTPAGPNGGMLSQLLRIYANNMDASRLSVASTVSDTEPDEPDSTAASPPGTGTGTGTTTPTGKKDKVKWYANKDEKKSNHGYTASLIHASMDMGRVGVPGAHGPAPPMNPKERKKKRKSDKNVKLTVHIAGLLARQQYIMQLCRALMMYGAPTHRLEEYMTMTANVLEVNAQFLYIPGCMFMSFDDPLTRTAEVKIIRVVQGLDLSRLAETHNVYKNVVHDIVDAKEGTNQLDLIMQRQPRYSPWLKVLFHGLASVAVGPYAFSARPIDLPVIFFLGSLVGFMQHILAPASATYANVLEVSAAILTSFIARALASIKHDGQWLFCFPALAESAIAMILPGFAVLSSSLELQSHQMIAGSIRMVYTIIYSLFLGYGVTVGTTIYGMMDRNATTQSTCPADTPEKWGNEYIQHFPFVALFCLFAALINQAKFKQLPVTVIMGVTGYVTNYFVTQRMGSNQVANTVGAFTIGMLANLYSRLWHGHAAAAIIPGIFTLVPSGLASSGSIIQGLTYAEEVANHTANSTTSTMSGSSLTALGFGMIQTAIGISVGLFIAALIVYPHGKKRSGIFSL